MTIRLKTIPGNVALSLVCTFTIGMASTGIAEAKSCVYNKAGFVLEAHWYKEGQIGWDTQGKFYIKQDGNKVYSNGKPVPVKASQVDIFPVLQGRCYNGNEKMVAVLAINGKEWFQPLMTTGTGIVAGASTATIAGVVCVLSAGAACVAAGAGAAVTTTALTGAMGMATDLPSLEGTIPNAFAIEVMSRTHYLDVWGTVFSPQYGQGGRI